MSTQTGLSGGHQSGSVMNQPNGNGHNQHGKITRQASNDSRSDSESTTNDVAMEVIPRRGAHDARHKTKPNGHGTDIKPTGSGRNATASELISNDQNQSVTNKPNKKNKTSSKAPRRLISPKMIFLKRMLKHVSNDNMGDKKAKCGKITCRNMNVFVGIYALLFMVRATFRQYFASILEHIQRHFTLSMREVEFLIAIEKIGFVIIIVFAGYYGNKMHKPVAVFTGAVFCACGAILCAVPYFLEMSNEPKNVADAALYYEAGLCQIGTNESQTSKTQCEALGHHPNASQAFSILATGNFIMGIGSAFLITLGFIYIEESTPKNTAPLYYGIILSMNGVGETLGLIVAWQFAKLPYTLVGSMELEGWSIGAWWMALPMIAVLFLIISFPLVIFPKWIIEPKWLINRRRRQLKHWLTLIKAEEKLINKVQRRQKRKRRKEEIAKRRKEKAKQEAESAVRRGEVHADDTGDGSLDGTTQAGGEDIANNDVIAQNGSVAKTNCDITENIDVEIHANNDHTTEMNGNIKDDSDDDSDNDETTSGRSSPQLQDILTEHDLHVGVGELGTNEPDISDAAPRRGVSFATDGSGEILVEVSMEVDDVLQMEEPPKAHTHTEDFVKSESSEKEKKRKMLGRRIQDLSKNLWFLINRPIFSLVLTGTSLAAYSPAGYQSTLPAYLSSELPMSHPPGFIVAGVPYTVGVALGAIVAGCVFYKRDWRLLTHVKIILVLQTIVIFLFLVAMAPHCDINYFFRGPVQTNGTFSDADKTCSSKCDCLDAQYDPVCSQDGVVFQSSCIAACRGTTLNKQMKIVYDQCLCLPDVELSSGFCNNGCYGATVGYGILVFLISTCQSFGQVSLVIIFLRCIAQKLRSLALGFAVFVMLMAAYVPGVAVFRYFRGMACLQKQEDCLGVDICWYYNKDTYRYIHHGVAAIFQLLSVAFYLATLFVLRAKVKAISMIKDDSAQVEITDALSNVTKANERSKVTDSNATPNVTYSNEIFEAVDNNHASSGGVENNAFEDVRM